MPRLLLILLLAAAGCASTPTRESDSLSHITQLTSGFQAATAASFSPDMRHLIFTAQPAGASEFQIYIAAVKYEAGQVVGIGPPVRVTPDGSRNAGGAFSPDGATVILATDGGLYRADGWRANLEAAPDAGAVNLARNRLPLPAGIAVDPSVSPDGRHLLFTLELPKGAAVEGPQLYAARLDGSHLARLTGTAAATRPADATCAVYPSFSPDGSHVAYYDLRPGAPAIRVADLTFDAAGDPTGLENRRLVARQTTTFTRPQYDPDGRHLVFAAARAGDPPSLLAIFSGGHPRLDLVRADGTHRVPLTFGPQRDMEPAFSPDGRYLLWTSTRAADGSPQVFVAQFKMPRGS